jgi:Predicted AAA-ATPase/PD-(D/E)XK nuclease superfamily
MKALVNIVFLFLAFLCNVESFTHHLRKGFLIPKSWIAASKLHAKEVRKSNGVEQWEQGSNNNKKKKKTSRSSLNLKFSSKRVKKAKHHGERKHIYLGTDNFDEILEDSIQYIDKTMFIQEWMEKRDEVSVFLRPRRFGKSTNLSMLRSFFSLGAESQDFSEFLIGQETEFMEEHCGKYPVVMMNMKGIDGDNWDQMISRIWSCLQTTLRDHEENLNEVYVKFIGVDCYDASAQPIETIAADFLKRLTSCLYKKFKKRVIVLIDEYDAPLNHAFQMGFYDSALTFFGSFYSNGLKSNVALERACLMGIVEMGGTALVSRVNNMVLYSSESEQYSQYFGFTKEEIRAFLNDDKEKMQEVMEWYNGYYIGSSQVINPWSFMYYMRRGKLKSYWVQTASTDSIRTTIMPVLSLKLINILVQLYEGKDYEIGELSTAVNYGSPFDIKLILCFLVHAGYLTYKEKKVFMPNHEIKSEWINCSFGVTNSGIINSSFQRNIMNALKAESIDLESLQGLMIAKLQCFSCFNTRNENVYHMFFYGIFTAVCGPNATSNREAERGQYGIAITFEDIKRLIVFELKHSKAIDDLEEDAKAGLNQILEKQYFRNEQYHHWQCVAIGVSFFSKEMSQFECREFKT